MSGILSAISRTRVARAAPTAAAARPPAADRGTAGRCRSWLRGSALGAVLALSGCSSLLLAPSTDLSDVPVPPAWSNGAATGAPPALAAWWQRFDDEELSAAIEQALRANTDVRTAQSALLQSRAQRDVAAAGLWPVLNAKGSAQRGKSGRTGPTNAFLVGFDAGWEPDVFGGVSAGVAAADANTLAAAASLGSAQVSIAGEVATTYITLRTLQLRMAIARDNLARQQETLQIAQWRAEAGLVTSLDVEQARTSTEQTSAQIPALDALIAQSRSSLAVLMGVTPEALQSSLRPETRVPSAPDDLALAFPAETLRQRPDVHRAEAGVSAAASQVSQADAARYPSFNLPGTLGLSALTLNGLGGSGALIASILGSVSLPIFDGGARDAQIRVQQAAYDQARIAYEGVVLTALKEVEDALVSLRTSRERLATLRRAAEAATNASLLARHRYESGLIDFQTVLQTQVTLLQVQDSVADAQAAVGLAHVRLYKALGGGWEPAPPAPSQARGSRPPDALPREAHS